MDTESKIQEEIIFLIGKNRIESAYGKLKPFICYKEDKKRFTNILRRNSRNQQEYEGGRIDYDSYLIHDNRVQNAFVSLVHDVFETYVNQSKIDDLLIAGNGYMDDMKFEKAIKAFKKVLEIVPRQMRANLEIGVALTNLSLFNDAIQYYTRVIEVYPNPRALFNRGNLFYILNKHEEACRDWAMVKSEGHDYADENLNKHCNN